MAREEEVARLEAEVAGIKADNGIQRNVPAWLSLFPVYEPSTCDWLPTYV